MKRAVSRRPALRIVVLLAALMALGAGPLAGGAPASHARYLGLNWTETGDKQAEFTLTLAFRCDFPGFSPTFRACPAIGTIFSSGDSLAFGDGSATPGLRFRVIEMNSAENWMLVEALRPGGTDDTIPHTYTGSGPYTARLGGCCTISTLQNNRDGNYETETLVDFARDDESPKSTVPPIVNVPSGGLQQWSVPAIDSGGETLRWRLATSAEACNGCSVPQPLGLTINASNGLVRSDTTGRPTGLYFTSVIIEALDASGRVVSRSQVTYLIRFSATSNLPPVWQGSTPPAGTKYECIQPGKELTIPLKAGDPNATNQVQILQFGHPNGATLDRTAGNPATATFRWTPSASQTGDHLLTFGAQDSALPPGSVFRSFTVQVKVCDTTPPDISVTTPEDGGKYGRGETVNADDECTDEAGGSGVESCVGDKAKGEASTHRPSGQRRSRSRPRTGPATSRGSRSPTRSSIEPRRRSI